MEKTKKKKSYIFTNKNHPQKGIVSTIFGMISMISIWSTIFLSYQLGGVPNVRFGAVLFLSTIFSMVGLGLGVASKIEKDIYCFFPWVGIISNFLSLGTISFILYAGAYGV